MTVCASTHAYVGCVPGFQHIVTHAPHVIQGAHLAFTGFDILPYVVIGVVACGLGAFLWAESKLRKWKR